MRSQTSISGRPSQTLPLFTFDVIATLGVAVPFCKAEIYHIDIVLALAKSNQEVIRFDIPVEEQTGMYVFYALDHLVGQHQDSLE